MRPSRTLYSGLNVHQDSIAVTDVAPSLIPKQAGTRVKTARRDAVQLARLMRLGGSHARLCAPGRG